MSGTGVELYKVQADKQGLRLAGKHPHPVAWWRYSHPARMLLLGTGDLGLWLQVHTQSPYQIQDLTLKSARQACAANVYASGQLPDWLICSCVTLKSMFAPHMHRGVSPVAAQAP